MADTANTTPIAWLSESEQNEILGEEFVKEFQAYRQMKAEAWLKLATKAAQGLTENGPAHGFTVPEGMAVQILPGKRPADSIGVKLVPVAEANKPLKPKAERVELAAKFANIGATLVKKGETLKSAGIPEIPAAFDRRAKKR